MSVTIPQLRAMKAAGDKSACIVAWDYQIAKIVDRFYEGVATDSVLRPLYPEEDLAPAAERFTHGGRTFTPVGWAPPLLD